MRPETIRMVRLWVEKAEHDFRAIEGIMTLEYNCPFDAMCFHCQQACEKYLKALLTFHSIEFPKTHDLLDLFNRMPASVGLNLKGGDLAIINRYSVEPRYPGDWESFTKAESEDALTIAKTVRDAIRSALPKSILAE